MSLRLGNVKGRAAVLVGDKFADVERTSKGKFSADPMDAVRRWVDFAAWARGVGAADCEGPIVEHDLGAPVPRPLKVFGIGMNYRAHATEAGMPIPSSPVVFTKFPNCITGPCADVELSSGFVDWEVELVVVIGKGGRGISEANAFDHIAGYMAGQDISDRKAQFTDTPPQFSMGKSYDTFGPTGPALVSLDAFADPNDLELTCSLGAEQVQGARTSDLIFSVSSLIAFLSQRCTLDPGDLIFTGTPAGVGSTRTPRRYLKPGEQIISSIESIGTLRNRCVESAF